MNDFAQLLMSKGRITLFAALSLAGAMPLVACGGKGTGKVEYSAQAEENYDRGREQLKNEDWIAAAKYFQFVRARFPYSKFAVSSELGIADAEFGAEHYLEAIDAYKMFIKFHPTHEQVENGYAAFRIGAAYYEMLPSDWVLLPPSYEKDQSATEDAYRELDHFLTKHKASPYVDKARKMRAECGKRLAQHEWYVANFYWDRGKPMATVLRLRRLLDRYPGVGYDAEAMWLLGRAYVKVGMPDRARSTWKSLIDTYPKHPRAGDARGALSRLTG